jgi:hypothetical protein
MNPLFKKKPHFYLVKSCLTYQSKMIKLFALTKYSKLYSNPLILKMKNNTLSKLDPILTLLLESLINLINPNLIPTGLNSKNKSKDSLNKVKNLMKISMMKKLNTLPKSLKNYQKSLPLLSK